MDKNGFFVNVFGIEFNHDSMFWSGRGLELYSQRNYIESSKSFSKAIGFDPKNPNLYIMRGNSYEDMGDYEKAEYDYKKSLELFPSNYLAAYKLGALYARRNQIVEATTFFRISYENVIEELPIEIKEDNIFFISKKNVATNLGGCLAQQGSYKEGIKYLDEAIALDQNFAAPYLAKGVALIQQNMIEDGISCVELAASLGSTKAEYILQRIKG